jgi:hypothetical protein
MACPPPSQVDHVDSQPSTHAFDAAAGSGSVHTGGTAVASVAAQRFSQKSEAPPLEPALVPKL